MKLLLFLKKNIFIILALLCIILFICNDLVDKKILEGATSAIDLECDNTCNEVNEDSINFQNFNVNISKFINLVSKLRGHCKNRCNENAPIASNADSDSLDRNPTALTGGGSSTSSQNSGSCNVDNCPSGLCNDQQTECIPQVAIGKVCIIGRNCLSGNCNNITNKCIKSNKDSEPANF